MKKASVFHETYHQYLIEIAEIVLQDKAKHLGASYGNNGLTLQFYDTKYMISSDGVVSAHHNDAPFAIKVILCKYVLMAREFTTSFPEKWMSYREFKDSGPLISYFANNTNKTIELSYTGKLSALRERCKIIGGTELKSESYDLSFLFKALPKIPVLLNFNDSDELFPSACSILFNSDAEKYLDMECLAMVGTYLTGLLVTNK